MELLGALLLVGASVFLILQPIISGKGAPLEGVSDEPSEAQFRKRVSLLQLRDAEYEFAMGKLDDADYQALRREISSEALAAIRAADQLPEGSAPGVVAGRDDLEDEISRVRAAMAGGLFCSQCGRHNLAGSRFCADCGTRLEQPTASGPT